MKRLLALLLALALGLGLFAPLAAAEDDPRVPVILRQPQRATVFPGFSAKFTIQAIIPNGDPIAYQWYKVLRRDMTPVEGATGATLTVPWRDVNDWDIYVCVVTNEAEGLSVESESPAIRVFGMEFLSIVYQLTLGPLLMMGSDVMGVFGMLLSIPTTILLAPAVIVVLIWLLSKGDFHPPGWRPEEDW